MLKPTRVQAQKSQRAQQQKLSEEKASREASQDVLINEKAGREVRQQVLAEEKAAREAGQYIIDTSKASVVAKIAVPILLFIIAGSQAWLACLDGAFF